MESLTTTVARVAATEIAFGKRLRISAAPSSARRSGLGSMQELARVGTRQSSLRATLEARAAEKSLRRSPSHLADSTRHLSRFSWKKPRLGIAHPALKPALQLAGGSAEQLLCSVWVR